MILLIFSMCILNFLVGILDGKSARSFMYYTVDLKEPPNYLNVKQEFLKSLEFLYPGKSIYDKIHLVITDNAGYMNKFIKELRNDHDCNYKFPNLYHVKCMAHILHRLCDKIRSMTLCLDQFIIYFQKIHKSILYKREYKVKTNLVILPKYITTRWGSYLTTVKFYHDNFSIISKYIYDNSNDKKFTKLIDYLNNYGKNEMKFVKKYLFLTKYIKSFESPSLSMNASINIIKKN